ncbi:MAG: hypothetical protein A3G87_08300 [Omnitrophica bacterium RIFCSPLOWO2_12_FULL_50_11]|nr:MAG: hypothetical protein A3G87_08300 [Omnitrophica bacterium RIFCSPLOWO2_12_FULL_50_11]
MDQITALLVDPDPTYRDKLSKVLSAEDGLPFRVRWAETFETALEFLKKSPAGIVLFSLTPPNLKGLETFEKLRAAAGDLPIVVVVAPGLETNAREALARGAQDYLLKDGSDEKIAARVLRCAIERKQIERERSEIRRSRSEFSSVVAHELRSPLTFIREGVVQVLDGTQGPLAEEQKSFLNISLQGIDRLSRVLTDLSTITKLEAGTLPLEQGDVDLAALAKQASQGFQERARRKGIVLKENLPDRGAHCCGSRMKTIQAVSNLIAHALETTSNGAIEIAVVNRESSVECSVSDTSNGICKEDLSQIFAKFHRGANRSVASNSESGLELALSKAIVEAQRGKIWVESVRGKGTKFTFSLPKQAVTTGHGNA